MTRRRPVGLAAALGLTAASVYALAAGPVPAGGPAAPAPLPQWRPGGAEAGAPRPGISGCRRCHVAKDEGEARDFVSKYKSNEFVRLNESTTWDREDVHSIAYSVLSGPLGERMGKVLGYKVTEAAACLTCHSVDLQPHVPLAEKKFDEEHFATTEGGVNCTVCHGLGRNWQQDHYEEPTKKGGPMPWRAKPPEAKAARGLADLRSPVVKARLCVSCHVGDPGEGKVVTHEMYAAGHPPLPPFELATFIDAEPRHWGYPVDTTADGTGGSELKFFDQFAKDRPGDAWKTFRFHPADKEAYQTRNMACGAVAALEAEMRLIVAEAADAAKTGGVDYARFDCYACHHDLKVPSARQERGYAGPPGRPPLKAWVAALPGVVAEHAKGLDTPGLAPLAAEFAPKWSAVRRAALAKPFGDPKALAKAAGEMAAWCDAFLKVQHEYDKPVYTPEQAKRLAAMVRTAAGEWVADTEASMHLTWAYATLRSDLKTPLSADALKALAGVLPLTVRDPVDGKFATDGERDGKKVQVPVPVNYGDRMTRFYKFDPKAFRDVLKDVP